MEQSHEWNPYIKLANVLGQCIDPLDMTEQSIILTQDFETADLSYQ